MKKWIAVLLSLAMVLSMAACGNSDTGSSAAAAASAAASSAAGSAAEEVSVPEGTGYYLVDSLDEEGMTFTNDELKELGMDAAYIIMRADYTGTFYLWGESMDFTWDEKSITANGDSLDYAIADGILSIDVDEEGLKFKYVSQDPPADLPVYEGEAMDGGEEIPYDTGYYLIDSVDEDGETYDYDTLVEMNMDAAYIIMREDYTGTLYVWGVETEFIWEEGTLYLDGDAVPYTGDGVNITLELEDVTLHFLFDSMEAPDELPVYVEEEEDGQIGGAGEAEPAAQSGDWEPVTETVGDYEVTVLGAEQFTDYEDDEAVRIWYEFTNNSDDLEYAGGALEFEAEEDGYDLTEAYCAYDEEAAEEDYDYLYVQPGHTIRCVLQYKINTEGSEIILHVEDWWTEESFDVTFDVQNLPGAPADEFEFAPVTDPTYTAGLPSSGTVDNKYDVSIDSVEYTTNYVGEDLVRVYMTFTNNSDEAISLGSAVWTIDVFQDGIELATGYANDDVPEDDNVYVDVAPGETLVCSQCYVLRTDDPYEVLIQSIFDGNVLGCVYTR